MERFKANAFNNFEGSNVLNIYSNLLATFEEPKQFNTSAAIWLSYGLIVLLCWKKNHKYCMWFCKPWLRSSFLLSGSTLYLYWYVFFEEHCLLHFIYIDIKVCHQLSPAVKYICWCSGICHILLFRTLADWNLIDWDLVLAIYFNTLLTLILLGVEFSSRLRHLNLGLSLRARCESLHWSQKGSRQWNLKKDSVHLQLEIPLKVGWIHLGSLTILSRSPAVEEKFE